MQCAKFCLSKCTLSMTENAGPWFDDTVMLACDTDCAELLGKIFNAQFVRVELIWAQHRHPRLLERELSRTPRERAPACPSFLRIRPLLPRRPGTRRPALDCPAARPPRPQAWTDRSRRHNVHKAQFRAACGVTCPLRILRKRPAGAFRG